MTFNNDEIIAVIVAVSFAAGLNLYATVATLGLLARASVLTLPGPISMLANDWVIGVSILLFIVEFFADKIPVFDLVWNALQTFVRVPAAALLAWSASSTLSPGAQLLVTLAGAGIALTAHSTKMAMRGAATTSPEPFSNIGLSLAEDFLAIGLTWFATTHPYLAAAIALVLVATTFFVLRWIWRALKRVLTRLRQRASAPA